MPNLVSIGPMVWISIPDTHTHTHTHTNPPGFNFIYKIVNEMKPISNLCSQRPYFLSLLHPLHILNKFWLKMNRNFWCNRWYSTEIIKSLFFNRILQLLTEWYRIKQNWTKLFIKLQSILPMNELGFICVTNFIIGCKFVFLKYSNLKYKLIPQSYNITDI